MNILLRNWTLPNYKKDYILVEESINAEISSNVIRVKPDIEFDLAGKLVLSLSSISNEYTF